MSTFAIEMLEFKFNRIKDFDIRVLKLIFVLEIFLHSMDIGNENSQFTLAKLHIYLFSFANSSMGISIQCSSMLISPQRLLHNSNVVAFDMRIALDLKLAIDPTRF